MNGVKMSGKLKSVFIIAAYLTLLISCSGDNNKSRSALQEKILTDPENYFYVDVKNYPSDDKTLPIGVFDSGTGGLTVLDAIVNFDKYNNENHEYTSSGDNKRDFNEESFIYLGDKANMPYGEYSGKNKTDLLKEHVLKDVQFLLGDKYYKTAGDQNYSQDKKPVKAIVIACNTATAFGKDYVEEFISDAGMDMKVIGVIGAGVRGGLAYINKDESASIGVFATNGTCNSNGYPNEIAGQMKKMNYTGNIDVFQQAGIGLAAAIDGEKEYLDPAADKPRDNYRGPSYTNELAAIDKSILDRYGFDWSSNNMLYEGSRENPRNLQINSIDNYIAYHVVSFMEKVRQSGTGNPVKTVILGCTHYPFYTDRFEAKFDELYNFKENGKYVYRDYMAKDVEFIDPAINTARELYDYLGRENLFNKGSIDESEFYISVPNTENENNVIDETGNFTYDYKYGRSEGAVQEYVKRVPFSRTTLPDELTDRLSKQIPSTYELIREFNTVNPKMKNYAEAEKILE
jgi:glutamate racemase